MNIGTRVLAVSALTALLLAWSAVCSGIATADEDKELRERVARLADAIEKDRAAAAKTEAMGIAKRTELEDVMGLLKIRKRNLFREDPNARIPEGIEGKIMVLGKRLLTPQEATEAAKTIARSAFVVAAISEIAQAKRPEKDAKEWKEWAKELEVHALKLAEAARKKDAQAIKAAATRVEGTCNGCHEKFR